MIFPYFLQALDKTVHVSVLTFAYLIDPRSPSISSVSGTKFKNIYRNTKYAAPIKVKFTMSGINQGLPGMQR